jgi:hypothetical protein
MLKLISVLDSATPFVQAFDCLLMLGCGVYCVMSARRRSDKAVMLLAVCCFVSATVLLGFFLSATYDTHPLLPLTPPARETAYVIARVLAPFELLLFAVAIIAVARRNRA